jgi:hypothetical protein
MAVEAAAKRADALDESETAMAVSLEVEKD